jgi:phosphoserine aminotransferase
MNFLGPKDTADYLLYGLWSNRAFDEAKMRGDIHGVPILEEEKPLHITNPSTWKLNEKAIYTHYCSNETISGVRLPFIPETKNALIADVSSDILSGPLDVSKFSLIYGCAQKNMGISGLAVVVLHKDMLEKVQPNIPTVFDFKKQTEFNSIYNTVNTFAIYVLNEVLKWNKEQGGLEEMQKRNHQKAQMLYDFIDASDFYSNNIAPDCRSIMNVTFYLPSEELDKQFDEASHKAGLCFLKGHRFHGGLRASIYNAMPLEGVQSLVDFMKSFEAAQP